MNSLCDIKGSTPKAVIKNIRKFLLSVKLPEKFSIVLGKDKYDVSYQKYAKIFWCDAEIMGKVRLENVYSCASKDIHSLCTGTTTFDADNYTLTSKKHYRIFSIKSSINKKKYTDLFVDFVKRYRERLLKGQCSLSSIALEVKWYADGREHRHSNIILSDYNSKDNSLTLMLYEPHGHRYITQPSKKQHPHYKPVQNLVKDIRKVMLYYKLFSNVVILDPKLVSCPIGLQSYAFSERAGLCELYSHFWLYCTLMVAKNVSSSLVDIVYIEKYIERYFSETELGYSITVFGVMMVQKLQERNILPIEDNKKRREWLVKKFYDKPNRKIKGRKSPNRKVVEIESADKKHDGEECKEDDECYGGICHKNVCTNIGEQSVKEELLNKLNTKLGSESDKYDTWSMDELKQRLEALDYE